MDSEFRQRISAVLETLQDRVFGLPAMQWLLFKVLFGLIFFVNV